MIERAGKKKMLIFSGSSNPELADKVAKELGTELAEVDKTCLLYTSPSPRD